MIFATFPQQQEQEEEDKAKNGGNADTLSYHQSTT